TSAPASPASRAAFPSAASWWRSGPLTFAPLVKDDKYGPIRSKPHSHETVMVSKPSQEVCRPIRLPVEPDYNEISCVYSEIKEETSDVTRIFRYLPILILTLFCV